MSREVKSDDAEVELAGEFIPQTGKGGKMRAKQDFGTLRSASIKLLEEKENDAVAPAYRWDTEVHQRFIDIVKGVTEDVDTMESQEVQALLNNDFNKFNTTLDKLLPLDDPKYDPNYIYKFDHAEKDEYVTPIIRVLGETTRGSLLLEMCKERYHEKIQGQIAMMRVKDEEMKGQDQLLREQQARDVVWWVIQDVQKRADKTKLHNHDAYAYLWVGMERFMKALPNQLITIDLRRYGVWCFSYVVHELEIQNEKDLWTLLEFLALRIPTPIVLRLLYYYRNELSKFDPKDRYLDAVCQSVVEGSEYPIGTCLMITAFMNELAGMDESQEREWKKLGRRYTIAATNLLEEIECDQLAAMIVECPTDLKDGPEEEGMSPMDIAIKFSIKSFTADSRIMRITATMWTTDNIMNPDLAYVIETKSQASHVIDMWQDGGLCDQNGFQRLAEGKFFEGPRKFFFTPYGKFLVEAFLYYMFIALWSAVTLQRNTLFTPVGFWDWVVYVCMVGRIFSEVSEFLDMPKEYLNRADNYIDIMMNILFILIMLFRVDAALALDNKDFLGYGAVPGVPSGKCNHHCYNFCRGLMPCGVVDAKPLVINQLTGEQYMQFNGLTDLEPGDDGTCPYTLCSGSVCWPDTNSKWQWTAGSNSKTDWDYDRYQAGTTYNGLQKGVTVSGDECVPQCPAEAYFQYYGGIVPWFFEGTWKPGMIDPQMATDAGYANPLAEVPINCQEILTDNRNFFFKAMWGIATILIWYRVLNYLAVVLPSLAKLQKMVMTMSVDVLNWFYYVMFILIGFTFCIYFMAGDSSIENFHGIFPAFRFMLLATVGDIDWGPILPDNPWADGDKIRDRTFAGSEANNRGINTLSLRSKLKKNSTYPAAPYESASDYAGRVNWDGSSQQDPMPFYELQNLHSSLQQYVGIAVIAYLIIGSIILLNLLIAMMASTFSTIEENVVQETQFEKTNLIIDYDRSSARLPPPFNLLVMLLAYGWKAVDYIGLFFSQRYFDINTLTPHAKATGLCSFLPGLTTPDPNKSITDNYAAGWADVNGTRKDGFFCGFCCKFVLQSDEGHDSKDGEENTIPLDERMEYALDTYFKHYENKKAPLDRADKLKLRNMRPMLCPFCWRAKDATDRDSVVSEIISYFFFCAILVWPMTIVYYPLYILGLFNEWISNPFDDMMNKPVKPFPEGINYMPDTTLVMPHPRLLTKDFGHQDKYRDIFENDESIWQLVEDKLGKRVEFTQEDARTIGGEQTTDKQNDSTSKAMGFQVDLTLRVTSVTDPSKAYKEGVRAGDKIIAINSKTTKLILEDESGGPVTEKEIEWKVVDRRNEQEVNAMRAELENPTSWPLIVTFAPQEEALSDYQIVGLFEDYPFEEVLNYFPWVPQHLVNEDENGDYPPVPLPLVKKNFDIMDRDKDGNWDIELETEVVLKDDKDERIGVITKIEHGKSVTVEMRNGDDEKTEEQTIDYEAVPDRLLLRKWAGDLIVNTKKNRKEWAAKNVEAWDALPANAPVPNTEEYNDYWVDESDSRVAGWGAEVLATEVSAHIPEEFEDKYKFPDYDKDYWKFLQKQF